MERHGRITHGCLGLYSDANEAALARVLDAARRVAAPGTRFAHPDRPRRPQGAPPQRPWEGGKPLARDEDAWPTVAPSAIPFDPDGPHAARRSTQAGLERVTAAFVQAAERAVRLGFDAIELHIAHGYLLHAVRLAALQHAHGRLRRLASRTACASRWRWRAPCAPWCRAAIVLGARITGTRLGRRRAGAGRCGGLRRGAEGRRLRLRLRVGRRRGCRTSRSHFGPGYQVPYRRQGEGRDRHRHPRRRPDRRARAGRGHRQPRARPTAWRSPAPSSTTPRWVWHAAERLGAPVWMPSAVRACVAHAVARRRDGAARVRAR